MFWVSAGPLALGTRASTPSSPKGTTERKTHRPITARLITALTGRPLSESSLYSECRPQAMSHPSSWTGSAAERGVLTRLRWLVPKSHVTHDSMFPELRESVSGETAEALSRTFHQGRPRKPTVYALGKPTCALGKPKTGQETGGGRDPRGNECRMWTRSPLPASRFPAAPAELEGQTRGQKMGGRASLQPNPRGWACLLGPADKPQWPCSFGRGRYHPLENKVFIFKSLKTHKKLQK